MKKLKNYCLWTFRSSKRKFYHSKIVLAKDLQLRLFDRASALHHLLARLDDYLIIENSLRGLAHGMPAERLSDEREKGLEQLEI
jgi:hypothetical protein